MIWVKIDKYTALDLLTVIISHVFTEHMHDNIHGAGEQHRWTLGLNSSSNLIWQLLEALSDLHNIWIRPRQHPGGHFEHSSSQNCFSSDTFVGCLLWTAFLTGILSFWVVTAKLHEVDSFSPWSCQVVQPCRQWSKLKSWRFSTSLEDCALWFCSHLGWTPTSRKSSHAANPSPCTYSLTNCGVMDA